VILWLTVSAGQCCMTGFTLTSEVRNSWGKSGNWGGRGNVREVCWWSGKIACIVKLSKCVVVLFQARIIWIGLLIITHQCHHTLVWKGILLCFFSAYRYHGNSGSDWREILHDATYRSSAGVLVAGNFWPIVWTMTFDQEYPENVKSQRYMSIRA